MNKLFFALIILVASSTTYAQTTKAKFGKGISIMAKDSSMSLKFQTRFQSLYSASNTITDGKFDDNFSDQTLLRRSRLKFSGHVYNPKITYKIELGLTNKDQGVKQTDGDDYFNGGSNIILDAVLKYKFHKNWSIWAGQTKLPGNRERVISSANLQFVDRSLVNSYYNIDRDMGIQLRHHFKLGEMVFKEAFAVSTGEGRDVVSKDNSGKSYTARFEWLPFGNFTSKGDYFGSDLKREEKPKLSIGVNYNLNQDARRQRGQLKSFVADSVAGDITTLHADFMFKHNGLSIMGEYAEREALSSNPYFSTANPYYTGTGTTLSMGYLLKSNWEPAVRYTMIAPDAVNNHDSNAFNEITLGLSRYIVGHNLKIQTDVTYSSEDGSHSNGLRYRLQLEMQL